MDNLNLPQTDRDWDYAAIWERLHQAKFQLEDVTKIMQEKERANEETDQLLYEKFELAINWLQSCKKLIEYSPKLQRDN